MYSLLYADAYDIYIELRMNDKDLVCVSQCKKWLTEGEVRTSCMI